MSGPVPHFLHVFSTFVPAGPETRAVRLIEAFGGAFRHSIVSMDGRTDARALLPEGADVRILESPPKAGSIATVRRLRDLLRAEQPDLLLSYNWGAFDAVMAARTLKLRRVVHHEDGFNPDEVLEFKQRRVLARRLVLPGVHRVVVPSKKLERIAVDTWRLANDRVRWIPNGIHAERFEARDGRPELRDALGIPRAAPLVGFVGHLRPEKNPLRLLRACARIDPALGMHVLIVGEGEERAGLEALVGKTPSLFGRVHFAGYVADPRDHYRAMDVYCLSSDTEQMPVALLEAMASGLAVVSTDVGDVRAILPDEQSPYVVPIEERESAWPIAEKLTVLVAGSRERERLGALNRTRVHERFTFEGMLAAYLDVYHGGLAA
ncbi:MAG TPA: glycosyltransferase [Planctomycetota bacterium]|nr:glycosyltransferase [Planctomycetota bacterium]